MQLLEKMAGSIRRLFVYENDLYKDEHIGHALVLIHGDILSFVLKAFEFLTSGGELRARIKKFKMMIFKNFDEQLGKEMQKFEHHLSQLESQASECDKKRIQETWEGQGELKLGQENVKKSQNNLIEGQKQLEINLTKLVEEDRETLKADLIEAAQEEKQKRDDKKLAGK